jgi:predicted TIM-barrel fold metal-dependent hydrolase
MNAPQILKQYHHRLDRVEARAAVFTEMQSYWSIPIKETAVVAGLAVSKGKYIVVLNWTCNKQEILQSSEHLI